MNVSQSILPVIDLKPFFIDKLSLFQADFSANIPSSTFSSVYPSFDSIGQYESSQNALPSIPKEYSTRKNATTSNKKSLFKNYNEIRKGPSRQGEYSTAPTPAASSTQSTLSEDDSNFFTIPKVSSLSTDAFDIATPEEIRRSLSEIKIPTRMFEDKETDLYAKLRGMPSIREQFREMSPTAPTPKRSSKFLSEDRRKYPY